MTGCVKVGSVSLRMPPASVATATQPVPCPTTSARSAEPVVIRCQIEALRDERCRRGREYGQLAVICRQVLQRAAGQLRGVAQRDADQILVVAKRLGESCEFEVGVGRLPCRIEHCGDGGVERSLVTEAARGSSLRLVVSGRMAFG